MLLLRARAAGTVRRTALAAVVAALGLTTLSSSTRAQQPATISGRVITANGNSPLTEARVMVVGTSLATMTNAEGRYTLRGVPTGTVDVRVIRVGYTEMKKSVQVSAGAAVTLDFSMVQAIVQLQEIVTTATGEQRRVELGNSVANLDVGKVIQSAPIKNMSDLMTARAPGVQVLPGNMTGGGARVRVRGTASLSLSNDPIYIIDGVRMTSDGASANISVGGTTPSRVSDLNPEEIENIEIVKGPSAATLYGTAAANGVVVITTKKGKAGAPQWTFSMEQGKVTDDNHYPGQYALLGKTPGTTTQRKCVLRELSKSASATGPTCVLDSAVSLNIFEDPDITPLKDGWRNAYNGQLGGGNDAIRYFTSGAWENEIGPVGLPAASKRQLTDAQTPILGEWNRPEALQKTAVRVNMNAVVSPTLDLSLQSGFTKLDQRLPQVDNNVNSFWYNAETGPGFKGAGPGYTGVGTLGQKLNGYAGFTPAEMFQETTTQGAQRYIGSANASWRPMAWLAARGDIGLDLTDRNETQLCRFAQCADFGTNRQGFATDARSNIRNFTSNLSATATSNPLKWLGSKTTAGAQYVNYESNVERAQGSILPPGAQVPSAGTTPSISNSYTVSKTVGLFVEEQVSMRDRMFLTGAVRTDQNSAFGSNFQRVYYPKFSASYVISDEDFFPKVPLLDNLRLRFSVGSSGVQPGQTDALRTFQTNLTSIAGADITGERSNLLGNSNLRPEKSTETETGFDAKLWNNRLNLELTYYSKLSRDALIDQTVAPDAGASVSSIKANLGAVKNAGLEAMLNGQIIDRTRLGWDMTLSYAHNSNKLVTLGTDPTGKAIPPIINTTTRQIESYPINGYWARPYTWADANGDGIITPDEVSVVSTGGPQNDGYQFAGYSQPRDEMTVQNGFDLLRHMLRVSALFDYKGGAKLFNNEEGFLCPQTTSCPETSTLNPELWRAARAVAVRDKGSLNTSWGYMESLQFWRFRELSVTYNLSDRLASKIVKGRGASLTLGARNLHVWTKWTATDPEQNYSQGDTQNTLLTAGPPRYYTVRLNLRY